MPKSEVTFGPMIEKSKGSIYYENTPIKKQEIFVAGVKVGLIVAEYKRSFATNTPFVVESYNVYLDVPTLNGSDEREYFVVRRYDSARAALSAAHKYVKDALSDK